jgi:hypothetical protein
MRKVWTFSFAALTLTLLAVGTVQRAAAQCMSTLGSVGDARGKPFQAEVHEFVPTLTFHVVPLFHEKRSLVARDSEGRIRTEIWIGIIEMDPDTGRESNHRRLLVEICDPVGLKSIWLDPLSKTARAWRLPSPKNMVVRNFCEPRSDATQSFPPILERQDLGHRMIEGVDAQGVTERSEADETQRWCAGELETTLLEIRTTQRGVQHRTAISNIQRMEPDPGLFVIPAGYKVLP